MKKLNYFNLYLLLALTCAGTVCEAHPAFAVKGAITALEAGDLEKAESDLQKARFEAPDSFEINYNLGIVAYRKRDYQKSVRFFARASELFRTPDERFNAFYNMGNAAFKGYDYGLAITAYKNALAVKTDYQADYNLKVAEKKLQEQLEKLKKQQEHQNSENKQNQNEQNKQDNQQQKNDQNQNEKQNGQSQQEKQNQQGQNGQHQNQQGKQEQQQNSDSLNNQQQDSQQNDQNGEKKESQNEARQGEDSDKQQQEGQEKDKQSSGGEEEKSDEQKGDEEGKEPESEKSGNASDSASLNEQKDAENNASATAPLNEVSAHPEEDRRDVQMAEDKGKVGRPEASQKARAMKNVRLNKDDVEAYLKQMEAKEAEAQKYYRINRIEDKDPAYMSQEELRQWMKIRNRKRQQRQYNEQDW